MHDWHIYIMAALLLASAGLWVLRPRARAPVAGGEEKANRLDDGGAMPLPAGDGGAPPDESAQPDLPHERAPREMSGRGEGPIAQAPNTTVLPFAEDRPVAILEFSDRRQGIVLRRGEVVIGRHSDDDVRIEDVRVSRHHAKLSVGSDGMSEIRNLTVDRVQPNPMLINGVQCAHAAVEDGDVISLGGVSFKYRRMAA